MATFKVGQRVRILAAPQRPEFVGMEAIVAAIPNLNPESFSRDCRIEIPGNRCGGWHDGTWACNFYNLAPLTDPKADAFLEAIRQLKPLNVSEVA